MVAGVEGTPLTALLPRLGRLHRYGNEGCVMAADATASLERRDRAEVAELITLRGFALIHDIRSDGFSEISPFRCLFCGEGVGR